MDSQESLGDSVQENFLTRNEDKRIQNLLKMVQQQQEKNKKVF